MLEELIHFLKTEIIQDDENQNIKRIFKESFVWRTGERKERLIFIGFGLLLWGKINILI